MQANPSTLFSSVLLGLTLCASAAVSLPDIAPQQSAAGASTSTSSNNPGNASLPGRNSPAQEAITAFQGGRYAKAIELARPLADSGVEDALYLIGFAYETGQGVEASREKALEYYRKAADKKQKDAIYRMSFILLASDKQNEREQAGKTLEAAAQDDPAVAGRILGEAYLRGMLSDKPNTEKTLFWWKRAADHNDFPSLTLLARLYEGQFGFPELKNLKQAYFYYGKAAEQGDPGAMVALGSRYLSGEKSLRDEAKGREWIKKAIAAKEYSAYLVLGDYEENIKQNAKAALAEYERGKDVSQVDCMLRAADFYLEGKGTEKDEDRGRTLLIKAADAGNPIAALRIAAALLSVEKPSADNRSAGYAYLLAAANANLAQAQNELGLLYLSGKLGVADGPAAVAWLTRAAQAGFAQAQFNLATLFERGLGSLPQNINNAGQLYTAAANQGHAPALAALARLVNDGTGTKADPAKAWALATLSVEKGNAQAEDLVKTIASQMSADQLAEAKKELARMKEDSSKGAAKDTKSTKDKPKKP